MKINLDNIMVLTPEQRQVFREQLPQKVYKTERHIAMIVALTQVVMMLLFLINPNISFENSSSRIYFGLYVFLFITTSFALVLHKYTYVTKKNKEFLRIRGVYTLALCIWVMGITYLEVASGGVISVYCYLLPTTAALLLLTPLESIIIFGGAWFALLGILLGTGVDASNLFSNMVNGTFVTVLTFFISYRYYRSMAIEFCDRETIASQYQAIQKSNLLFRQMARIDQLTGLYNRHYLLEKIYPRFESYKKKNAHGTLIMIDIDFFKQYNDTFGHVKGDECLKQIAEILKRFCCIHGGEAIRYGGEEFLIIMFDEKPLNGETYSNALLETVSSSNLRRHDVEFGRVTISVGLWCAHLSGVQHIEEAIKCADEALYQAKALGRNQIVKGSNCI